MRVTIKVVLTFALLMTGTIIIGLIKSGLGTHYSTGGIGPLIIYPALMAGIYAIWKWKPDENKDSSTDNEMLKKD
jgi:hypothetical protein